MKSKFLLWFSWASPILPFAGYVLCSMFSTGHLYLYPPSFGRSVVRLRHYTFLASGIVGGIILLADLRFGRWRLVWLPLASLILTYLLFIETAMFTLFYD